MQSTKTEFIKDSDRILPELGELMSVTLNAKGTSVPTFTVGKNGTTLGSTGTIVPPTGNNLEITLAEDNYLSIDSGTNGPALITTSAEGQDLHINPAAGGGQYLLLNSVRWPVSDGTSGQVLTTNGAGVLSFSTVSGTGTVTDASVVTVNGFSGSVTTSSTTPAITLSTTVTGILKGDGTAISAATAGTDYLTPLTGDVTTSGNEATLVTINSDVGQFAVTTLNAKGLATAASDLLVTGDATGMSSGASIALTLATVNSNTGTFGNSFTVPVVTVNAKGLVTSVSTAPISAAIADQDVQVISANTTAVKSRFYVLTATLTLTLPITPSVGDWVTAQNSSGTTTAVIARNGTNIMSLAEDLVLDANFVPVTLVYADSTRGWVFG